MSMNLCNQRVKKHYLEKENNDISFVSTHAKGNVCVIPHFSDTQAKTRVIDQCISKGEKSVSRYVFTFNLCISPVLDL